MEEDVEDNGDARTRTGKLEKMGWMRDVTRTGGREIGEGEERERKRDSLSGDTSSRRSEVCQNLHAQHRLPVRALAGLGTVPPGSLHAKDTACRGQLLPSADWSSPSATSGTTGEASKALSDRPRVGM